MISARKRYRLTTEAVQDLRYIACITIKPLNVTSYVGNSAITPLVTIVCLALIENIVGPEAYFNLSPLYWPFSAV